MSNSIGVFGAAVVLGYFLLPIFLSKEQIKFFLAHTTNAESAWRDGILKFLTDRLGFITPNFVSYVGLILVFLVAYPFQNDAHYGWIFFVTLLAGFSDMLDGSLARNTSRVTKLGAVLDVARDLLLVVVLSYYLIITSHLSEQLFFWFAIGWIFLGGVRSMEFKFSSGKTFSLEEDYKFVLDRLRLFLYVAGILFLILIPLAKDFRDLGETFIVISIVISWISLLFHSAHLKILREDEEEGDGLTI